LDIPAKVYARTRKRTGFLEQCNYEYPLLTLACDVLIPAALENQITEENVHQIQADIVAEAANGPVTLMADQALEARGVTVLPDILTNAGGGCVTWSGYRACLG